MDWPWCIPEYDMEHYGIIHHWDKQQLHDPPPTAIVRQNQVNNFAPQRNERWSTITRHSLTLHHPLHHAPCTMHGAPAAPSAPWAALKVCSTSEQGAAPSLHHGAPLATLRCTFGHPTVHRESTEQTMDTCTIIFIFMTYFLLTGLMDICIYCS